MLILVTVMGEGYTITFDEDQTRTPIFVKCSELVLLMAFWKSEFVKRK